MQTFIEVAPWQTILGRRSYIGRESGKLYCHACKNSIQFTATARRLLTKQDEEYVEAKELALVLTPFCTVHGPSPSDQIYGSIVYDHEIKPLGQELPDIGKNEVIQGYFVLQPSPGRSATTRELLNKAESKQVVPETTIVGRSVEDVMDELGWLKVRLDDPKYRIRQLFEERKADLKRRIAAYEERIKKERELEKQKQAKLKRLRGE